MVARRRAMKRTIIFIITLLAFFIFGATLARAYFSPADELSLPDDFERTTDVPPSELPEMLEIPAIGVDTDVQHVGIGRSGNMAVPTNYSDVGWFRLGTVPGQTGSAVIDGHVDNGFGLAAVFKRLHELKRGDSVYVTTREGTRLHFRVESVEEYALKDVPSETLFNRADVPRLNLITCSGNWLEDEDMYDRRTVVYTVLVDVEEAM